MESPKVQDKIKNNGLAEHLLIKKPLSLIPVLLSLQKLLDIVTLVFSDILLITIPYIAVAFIAHYVSAAFMAHYVR